MRNLTKGFLVCNVLFGLVAIFSLLSPDFAASLPSIIQYGPEWGT
ncbi:hypothetical protein [Brevibacillus agri]|nr:hypothetical protein [Brevibacillus agri]EJL45114.1 hypothetical protein PMI08_01890 [Brevibacillus sp. CF112]MED4570403.1 hypothetical protein [Brevibacillus agri]WHX28287.1 hypothetical protein QNK09_14250 [Brevibacillus agri]